jgi:L-iditol 2-dehydrogenase
VGICGTDVKILHGAIPAPYPITMGHEMIGEIVTPATDGLLTAGTRVLVDPAITCGSCDLCFAGRPHLCVRGGLLGRDADGVFGEFVTAPESRLITVPNNISLKAAGVLQVLGTCVHAQRAINVFPGDVAVVIGLGVSGQLFVQLLKARGATVLGVTRSEWKRDLARQLGADATAAPDEAQAVLDELSGGRGADIAVESAGTETTLGMAVDLAATGGEVLVFGTLTKGEQGLPYYNLYIKELTLYNPRAAMPTDYQRGIELAAKGILDLEPIVTHELELGDVAEAFTTVEDRDSLKVLMQVP